MTKLEVLSDYACPYCYEGHKNLRELLPELPDIQVVWNPFETHRRSDRYGKHSDICIMGMYYSRENNLDIIEYHDIVYKAVFEDRIDIENIHDFSEYLGGFIDRGEFTKQINDGKYKPDLKRSNAYAYKENGIWVVPSYKICNEIKEASEHI